MFSRPRIPPKAGFRRAVFRLRRRTDRRRLRGFAATAVFRRRRRELLRLRLRRGFTFAAKAVFRRRDRRRLEDFLRRLLATLTLLVLHLILVTTLTLFRLLRRGAARVLLRRREILRRLLRTFRSLPLLSRGRPLRELRRRFRLAAITFLLFRFGFVPIKAR